MSKDEPVLTVKEVHEVRWLAAVYKSVEVVYVCFDSILSYFISFHFIHFIYLFPHLFRELQGLKSSLHEVNGEGQRYR